MKPSRAMRFPWRGANVPHGVLDILRHCDIECEGCYNRRSSRVRSREEIRHDLNQLLAKRRLHTVTLSGGEPTLHPELLDIVADVANRGLTVAMLTNGAALSADLLRALKAAGLSLVLLHIQSGQRRRDLSSKPRLEEVRRLREEKARMVVECGIEAGLSVIAYRSRLGELEKIVDEVLESPFVNILLVTEFTDFTRFRRLVGSLERGLTATSGPADSTGALRDEEVTNEDIVRLMKGMGFEPYAFLGSSHDPDYARWLSYRIGVVRSGLHGGERYGIRPGVSDRILVRLVRLAIGRYPFFPKAGSSVFRVQVFLNALSGGNCAEGLRLLSASAGREKHLYDKHLLFQEGPRLLATGEVGYCQDCPDAIMIDGELAPVCLADRLEAGC